jgi:hypothetical protein
MLLNFVADPFYIKQWKKFMRIFDLLEILRTRISGHQPVVKISDSLLRRIVEREFSQNTGYVYAKLKEIKSETPSGANRISACVIKLANRDIHALDKYVLLANNDYRDVISLVEYPSMADKGLEEHLSAGIRKLYIQDYKDYTSWLYG